LALTLAAPVYALQEQHEQEEQKDKPAQEKDNKAQPEKPAKPEEKNAQQEKNTNNEEKNAQKENNTKQDDKNAQQQDKNTKQDEKSAQQQRTTEAKPGNQEQHASAGRIPADRYKANFGSGHTFHVTQSDFSSGRFQYGGYWFGFNGGWPSNWLYTQDVYVIEIDGMYYLCNPMYPGVNLALVVTL
jgi:hypothetical protein